MNPSAEPDTTQSLLCLWTDDNDTIVAESLADAAEVWKQMNGDTYEDAVGDKFDDCWRRVGDDAVITIRDDEGKGPETKRAKEWAASNGRGFLCSKEF